MDVLCQEKSRQGERITFSKTKRVEVDTAFTQVSNSRYLMWIFHHDGKDHKDKWRQFSEGWKPKEFGLFCLALVGSTCC